MIWGCSSFGRAAALQAVGSQFDPDHLHQDYRGVGESSRPRQSHKLEIGGANPSPATNF